MTDSIPHTVFPVQLIAASFIPGVDTNVFVGVHLWTPFGARGVYGGQVAAQALCSACFTVPHGFAPNSQHCMFLRSADGDRPIVYTVHRIRTGRSFATRWCVATQAAKPVFACSVSFHTENEETSPLEHQVDPPIIVRSVEAPSSSIRSHDAPSSPRLDRATAFSRRAPPSRVEPPEELPGRRARFEQMLRDPRLPEGYKHAIEARRDAVDDVIDMRPCGREDPLYQGARPPEYCVWMRAAPTVAEPDGDKARGRERPEAAPGQITRHTAAPELSEAGAAGDQGRTAQPSPRAAAPGSRLQHGDGDDDSAAAAAAAAGPSLAGSTAPLEPLLDSGSGLLDRVRMPRALRCRLACVVSFLSDFNLLAAAMRLHGWPNPELGMMVSLDHTVWFHRTAALGSEHDWLLLRMRSPSLGSARGFALGEIFSRDGRMVASCAQEGLIRMRKGYRLPRKGSHGGGDGDGDKVASSAASSHHGAPPSPMRAAAAAAAESGDSDLSQ